MEPNLISALVAALANTSLAPLAVYAPLVVTVAAVLAAILPQPTSDSPWQPARRLIDLLAMNVGAAKNASNAGAVTSTSTVMGLFISCALASLAGCSAAQNAQVVANLQNVNTVAVQDARLFCAVATPAGPVVVAVANAAGAPVIATGTAQIVVNSACAAVNGIPVIAPPVGSPVATVAALVAPNTPTAAPATSH
jgi:hypothetical protein